ncbi:MAG: tyrosine-type recombinase/integrase [Defluviitaleaceae bacterium]|nr:tyrosine-type recombinase/integrase [Defluviitaleaceae bacterium]
MRKVTMRSKNEVTVTEAIDRFLRKGVARNLSDKTLDTYRKRLRPFQGFLNDDTVSVSSITKDTVADYTLHLKETGNRNDITTTSFLRDLRVFLYFCMDEGSLQRFKIKLPKVDKPIKETYLDEELKSLLKKPNIKTCDFTEYKIWVLTNYLMATGNRISSALDVKIEDLDFTNALIQVNKTKNRKAQILPMSATLATVLQEYLIYRKGEAGDYLFCNSYGDKGEIRTYQEMLASYNKARGVAKTSAHLYRHTFAKKWILNGGDIFRLQKILGHSDLTMVREYVNMFGNEISLDFNRFNPLDNMGGSHAKDRIKM